MARNSSDSYLQGIDFKTIQDGANIVRVAISDTMRESNEGLQKLSNTIKNEFSNSMKSAFVSLNATIKDQNAESIKIYQEAFGEISKQAQNIQASSETEFKQKYESIVNSSQTLTEEQKKIFLQQEQVYYEHTQQLIEYDKLKEKSDREQAKVGQILYKNMMKNASTEQKAQILSEQKMQEEANVNKLKRQKKQLQAERQSLRENYNKATGEERELIQKQIDAKNQEIEKNSSNLAVAEGALQGTNAQLEEQQQKLKAREKREDPNKGYGQYNFSFGNFNQRVRLSEEKLQLEDQLKNVEKNTQQEFLSQKFNDIDSSDMSEEEKEEAKKELVKSLESNSEYLEMLSDNTENLQEKMKENTDALGKNSEAFQNQIFQLGDTMTSLIDEVYQKSALYESRLEGATTTYSEAVKSITNNIGLSPYVSSKNTIGQLQRLIQDYGISYNVEFRAFLEEIKTGIANTFDVTNETLLRLVRLQQSDSSAARLGMEAFLNKMYNTMYQDSSYLQSTYDTVASNLIQSSALMSKEASQAFEFQVQKWLGALYSLGMDQNTISQISTAINLLGSGNVEQLQSNESALTLLAMSAGKAGLPFADLLTKGLNDSNVNQLLTGMMTYLSEIAESVKDNNVVANAYGNVLGLTMADYTAIRSISSDIPNLSAVSMDYSSAVGQYIDEAGKIGSRIKQNYAKLLGNVLDNLVLGSAMTMADSPALYGTYQVMDLLTSMGIDISVPFINVWGFGLDLNDKIFNLVKTGAVGLSLLGALMGGLGKTSVGPNATTFLPQTWGYNETVIRGEAPTVKRGTLIQTGFSQSGESSVSNASGEDIESSTLASSAESAKKKSSIINAGIGAEYTFDDFYKHVIKKQDESVLARILIDAEWLEGLLKILNLEENPLPVKLMAIEGIENMEEFFGNIAAGFAPAVVEDEMAADEATEELVEAVTGNAEGSLAEQIADAQEEVMAEVQKETTAPIEEAVQELVDESTNGGSGGAESPITTLDQNPVGVDSKNNLQVATSESDPLNISLTETNKLLESIKADLDEMIPSISLMGTEGINLSQESAQVLLSTSTMTNALNAVQQVSESHADTIFRQMTAGTVNDNSTNNYTNYIQISGEALTETIKNLESVQLSLGNNNNVQDVNITNSDVPVDIKNMPDTFLNELKTYAEQTIKQMIIDAISQGTSLSGSGDDKITLAQILSEIRDNTTTSKYNVSDLADSVIPALSRLAL